MLYLLKYSIVLVRLLFACLSLLLIACNNVPEKNYISTGDYYIDHYNKNDLLTKREIFFKDGEKIIMNFANGKFISSKHSNSKRLLVEYLAKNDSVSSSTIYYDSIILRGEGRIDYLNRPFGWWTYRNAKGELIKKNHFHIINDTIVENQVILYKKGNIDTINSCYADITLSKKKGKLTYIANLTYHRTVHPKSFVSILIGKNIKKDLSNLRFAIYDTIAFTSKPSFEFPVKFETSGRKKIRGFVIEQYSKEKITERELEKKKQVELVERRIYFDKELVIPKE